MYNYVATWLGLVLSIIVPVAGLPAFDRRKSPIPPRSIVYVQTFHTRSGSPLSLLPLIQHPTTVTHVYLAALHINDTPGDVKLNDNHHGDAVFDAIWSDAAELQRRGVKIVTLLGGAAQGSFWRLCSGNVINEKYYGPLQQALRFHNVDGVDLGIEERINLSCPLALLRRFDQDFGTDFILTMSPVASELQSDPVGLSGLNHLALDAQATSPSRPNGKLVSWYNAQFYNGWGDASVPADYVSIIENGFSPDRVVMGVLDSPDDRGGDLAPSGWYFLPVYKVNISLLKAKYNNFGGVFGWEYHDAGERDGYREPWQWVQDVGRVVFAASNAQYDVATGG